MRNLTRSLRTTTLLIMFTILCAPSHASIAFDSVRFNNQRFNHNLRQMHKDLNANPANTRSDRNTLLRTSLNNRIRNKPQIQRNILNDNLRGKLTSIHQRSTDRSTISRTTRPALPKPTINRLALNRPSFRSNLATRLANMHRSR